jgi:hypothetical protein
MKQRSFDGQGARSALFGVAMRSKKTGARSARARMRGQNPLVSYSQLTAKPLIRKSANAFSDI